MKISVVIPAYNAEKFIGIALDSVKSQTRTVDEIVVADDASSDATLAAVEQWSAANAIDVKIVRLEQNGGAGAARNGGFRATDADVVGMLDADDSWQPNLIADLVGALEAHPQTVIAFGLREYEDSAGGTGEYQGQERIQAHVDRLCDGAVVVLNEQQAYLLNLRSSVTSCSAAVVKRQAAIECGLYDPAFRTSQDREFFLRLSRIGPFALVNTPVSLYRLHSDNTTHSRHAIRNAMNGTRVLAKMLDRHADIRLDTAERAATLAAYEQAAQSALYVSSQRGWQALRTTMRDLGKLAVPRTVRPLPKTVVRAIYRSVRPDPDLAN